MKITKDQKQEVRDYLRKYREMLFLNIWDFEILYLDEISGDGVAFIKMQPDYFNAIIEIDYKRYFELPKEQRDEIILHELSHIILYPAMELAERASNGIQITNEEYNSVKERVTQHITRSIYYKK